VSRQQLRQLNSNVTDISSSNRREQRQGIFGGSTMYQDGLLFVYLQSINQLINQSLFISGNQSP